MLPPEGRDLILAGAIISIFLNPLIFALIVAHPEPAEPEEKAPKAIAAKGHVILIGYGRVGSLIAAELKKRGQSFVVIEYQADMARRAENDDIRVLPGNALDQRTLETAGIKAIGRASRRERM